MPGNAKALSGPERYIYLLGIFIPVAVVLRLADGPAAAVFFTSAIAVVPCAALMGKATEELAARSGPGIGGLLNVTFGNAPELIIALLALGRGLQEVVKASIVGSVLGNVLLVLGASMLAGGLRREKQTFNRTTAGAQSAMLLLALAAMAMPAIFQLVDKGTLPGGDDGEVKGLSIAVAAVLIASYAMGLIFSLRTHRDLFNPPYESEDTSGWSVRRSVSMLALSGALVGLMSEILVGSIEAAAHSVGLSEFFIGVIIVAIVGNAAEHWVAVLVAMKDKMDLSVNIAVGSATQVALFVAPVLVFLSYVIGPQPLTLVFNGFELAAVFLAVLIADRVTAEGECNWFEGVQLLSVYAVLGTAFYFA